MHEKKNDNTKKILQVRILKSAKITSSKNRLFISIQAAFGLTQYPPNKS